MKKSILIIVVTTLLCLVFSIGTNAAGVNNLDLVNYIDGYANKVKANPKSDMLLIHDGQSELYLYSINTGISKKLPIETNVFNSDEFCISNDGSLCAVTFDYSSYSTSRPVYIFDCKSGELINEIFIVATSTPPIAFTSDNSLISANHYNEEITIIDIHTGEVKLRMSNGGNKGFYQNPTNSHIAAKAWSNMVHIYDAKTGGSLKTLELSEEIGDMAYSPNGKYLVVRSGFNTIIYDTENNYSKLSEINYSGRISFDSESSTLVIGDRIYFPNNGFNDYTTISDGDNSINPDCAFLTQDGKYYINYSYNRNGIRMLDASQITVHLKEIRLEPSTIEISPNEELSLNLVGIYSDGSTKMLNIQDAKCVISDFSVAKMTTESKLQGLTVGEANLNVTYQGLTATQKVSIISPNY